MVEQTIDAGEMNRRKRKAGQSMNDTIVMAVREGRHVLLDVSRRVYYELQQNIEGES